ncbi:hypothetical protein, partial [Nocardia sp. NPDC049707]|uniref:hypothetical protein n=1 Tax=Nocardia sp. NPDC049707 TaxID=3154735 RepID=UPI003430D9A6
MPHSLSDGGGSEPVVALIHQKVGPSSDAFLGRPLAASPTIESPESVNPDETGQAACSVSVFSFAGRLIHAASGN